MPAQLNRDSGLDAVRALAIVMVVAIHVTSAALYLPVDSAGWWSALAWGSVVRPAVPLFFLCSGALMLSRDIPLGRLYGHNLLRVLVAMFVWAFLYRLVPLLSAGLTPEALWDALKQTLVFKHQFHFYYLHILLLIYVCVPVLRTFLRNAARREVEYFLAVWFVTGILLPMLKGFWPFSLVGPITGWWILPMGWAAMGYAVLGFYLKQWGGTIPRKAYALLLVAGLAIAFVGTGIQSQQAGALAGPFLEGMSPGPAFMAAGIFGLVTTARRPGPRLLRLSGWLARSAFCIYLSHVFFLNFLQARGFSSAGWIPALSIPILTVIIVLISGALYEGLRRIPWVRRWLV